MYAREQAHPPSSRLSAAFSAVHPSLASFPGLPRGEGRPGAHCLRMREFYECHVMKNCGRVYGNGLKPVSETENYARVYESDVKQRGDIRA